MEWSFELPADFPPLENSIVLIGVAALVLLVGIAIGVQRRACSIMTGFLLMVIIFGAVGVLYFLIMQGFL